MRKITLYIAASLNGKIARADGSVDWLEKIANPEKTDYGYADFLASIDTTIQGHNTYKQLVSWEIEFPYKDKINYVLSRDKNLADNNDVKFVSEDHTGFIKRLKNQEGKGIWLIGGGEVNTLMLNEKLIDELHLFIMPVVLTDGIDIFRGRPDESLFTLVKHKIYLSGVVEAIYHL